MSELLLATTLSESFKHTLKIAQAIAKENMNSVFAPAHLLKALLHKDAGLQSVLKQLSKDICYIEEWAEVRIEAMKKSIFHSDIINADLKSSDVINEADNIRIKLKKDSIEPLHALAAVCTPGVGFNNEQLKTLPLCREELLRAILENNEISSILANTHAKNNILNRDFNQHALLKYCIDKSLLAKQNKLDAIIGRDKEIRMMAEIITRRSKPNVMITGEPGVGKSALVDGFALAILQQKVPRHLYNANLFELDIAALVAGASYKGEIEDRLKNIIKQIKQLDKAILFIDEIHSLLDKHGSAQGIANLLKPELESGELTVIGATTLEEYRKHIETDEAFARRFELLVVEEPSEKTCFYMLKAIMPYYEKHHSISIPDDTIKEIIRLAKRYIKDRRLPDAGIDLADRSMAALKMLNDTADKDIQAMKDKYFEWCKSDKDIQQHTLEEWQWFYNEINGKVSPILLSSIQSEEDPSKMTEVDNIKNYLTNALDNLTTAASQDHSFLGTNDVAAIVSYKTGIPLGKIKTQEKERLLNMDSILKKRVVGQDHAIKAITEAVLESRSGLNKLGQPMGSFFFLGPTGTGKTELAKALAEFLFLDESFMIRFDMSEFKEEHAAALLYGAPPGYVGYEEGGLLVNKIRQQPYSVVLFDEIEKAHPSVFDLFLQIMDEGKLHDKLGKVGDFSNALIIFTSNIGSQYFIDAFDEGGIPESNKLMEMMSQHFRPEFLGRLTEIIPFAPMSEQMIQNILTIQLKNLFTTLEKQGIKLSVTEAAIKHLALAGFTPKYGARPLSGVIRNELRRPLSRKIICGEISSGTSISLNANDKDELQWKIIE